MDYENSEMLIIRIHFLNKFEIFWYFLTYETTAIIKK